MILQDHSVMGGPVFGTKPSVYSNQKATEGSFLYV